LNSVDIPVIFDCPETAPAVSISGLNTFMLSASTTATTDLVSIGVTVGNNGVTDLPDSGGTGFFVASTINIGAASSTTATVDDNGHALPVGATLCRTNPTNGACVNPQTPGPSVTFVPATNEIAAFTILVRAPAAVPFDPANNRLFLRFTTQDGVARGATSVAVRTIAADR
jgi:hypothetical protein